MPYTALKAHFDGQQIQLEEAFNLPVGAALIVIVAVLGERDDEFRNQWSALGKRSLSRVYGDDEPEYRLKFDLGSKGNAYLLDKCTDGAKP